ncbi:MAG: hypothetical protein M3425_02230 [Actinomycetota bacterium]|jgi:energy-coupling factor transporter transmembrane protein EcfT|nr:hypothetical protein [Euzebyaceae bacterium]MDQ3528760.1 hypothetical protein [Actinomycetota bacterium]
MSLTSVHGYVVGVVLIGTWATICGWSLALRFTRYEHTPTFWRVVSFGQILLALQLLIGLMLLVLGKSPGPEGGGATLAFHLAYGVIFPLLTLIVGHRVAREGRYNPHAVFAVVGLVCFGLTARAFMVGVGGA